NVAGGKPSSKSRWPLPRTVGGMGSRYSAIRPGVLSEGTRAPLPMTWGPSAGEALSLATAPGPAAVTRGVFGGSGARRAVVATHWAAWLRASVNGLSWVFQ